MTWQQFLAKLKKLGYDGSDDDLAAVKKWLKGNGHDPEKFKAGDTVVKIDDLYEDRPGKALDLTAEYKEAEEEKRWNDRLEQRINALTEDLGLRRDDDRESTKEHRHDIEVTDLAEKSDCVGYPKHEELGFGMFLRDVMLAQKASNAGRPSQAPARLVKSQKIMEDQIIKQTGMNESVDADGGFLAPTEHRRELLRKTHEAGMVFQRARVVPMMSRAVDVPYVNETSRADGSRHGGVRGYWGAEGGTLTTSRPTFGKLTLTAHKLHALGYVTSELEEDGIVGSLQLLSDLFSEELAFMMDTGFIRGDGVGKPLGILNSPALVSFARNTTLEIRGVDVITMWSRMWARSRPNSVWFINQDIEPMLMRLGVLPPDLSTPTAALPMWLPANGLAGSPFSTLMGRPVIPIEQCSTLGTVGDIILADMNQYLHGQRRGVTTAQSIHIAFTTDEVAFRATLRSDGSPWWNSPLIPFQGTNTQSPFVALAVVS